MEGRKVRRRVRIPSDADHRSEVMAIAIPNSPAPVAWPLQRNFLDLIEQIHVRPGGLHGVQKPVVAGAAESGYLAHLKYAHAGFRFHFRFNLGIFLGNMP
jgi:hypothetical protein